MQRSGKSFDLGGAGVPPAVFGVSPNTLWLAADQMF
jgi:hypothetical protein